MENKSLIELENSDYKEIIKKIKEDKNNNCGLIKLVNDLTNKNYIEQKAFVQFNVITKEKNRSVITCKNFSIGYLLPNNTIYDFISGKVYPIYKLHETNNINKNGEYALINCLIFENSKKKIKLYDDNLIMIEEILKQFVDKYRPSEKYIKKFKKDSENPEHVPEITKNLTRY